MSEKLPEHCCSILPSTGELIVIKRGERGYYRSEWNTDSREENKSIADFTNNRMGITPAQLEAMICGSMCGWDVPGAQPQFYLDRASKEKSVAITGHIKHPVLSTYFPVKGQLHTYRIMGTEAYYQSPLDQLFLELEYEKPDHIAVHQYKIFKQAAGKTAKTILVSAAVRLAALAMPQFAAMTFRDDMDFGSLGERKRAIFCVIPVADGSMNYLVGMLYTQCFQELYRVADEKYNGKLPIPVRVIQDEWANVAQPDSYPKILATCRSYNISLNIIVQNIAQIKNLYEKEWESIIGNCDTLLFLGGGNEPTSLEFMSKLLGKETLDTRTRGLTRGHSGSSSTNYQQAGRELMMQEEIRLMDTDDSILLIRGERPVLDKKYDLIKHPNIKLTEDGGAAPYVHKSLPTKFEVSDLPYDFRSLDDYQFDTMEEFDHENPDEDEEE